MENNENYIDQVNEIRISNGFLTRWKCIVASWLINRNERIHRHPVDGSNMALLLPENAHETDRCGNMYG